MRITKKSNPLMLLEEIHYNNGWIIWDYSSVLNKKNSKTSLCGYLFVRRISRYKTIIIITGFSLLFIILGLKGIAVHREVLAATSDINSVTNESKSIQKIISYLLQKNPGREPWESYSKIRSHFRSNKQAVSGKKCVLCPFSKSNTKYIL